MSYFAFTATPKLSTLQLFGRLNPDKPNPRKPDERGMYEPFHVYSMRQAIDEGYILDVLANYITYQTKWKLRNIAVDQEESATANLGVEENGARRKPTRLAALHPTSVEQKAKLIVDDFREAVSLRMGGRAKAMVVTRGRQHALDLYQAIRAYAEEQGFTDCGTLVAFSGRLRDAKTQLEFTEAQLNSVPEGQLLTAFGYAKADAPDASGRNPAEYRILVVADKYQTGFDEPLLCCMYIDKPLTGIAAVQTLSRLNRIHPLKTQDDVRIVDFVNTAEDIRAAFEPWFETTITEPTDPSVLYDRQRDVMDYGILAAAEMELFARLLADGGPGTLQSAGQAQAPQLNSCLLPALGRFVALGSDEEREGFRAAMQHYLRAYSLLAPVYEGGDGDLERLYQYGRALLARLPGRPATSIDAGLPRRATTQAEESEEIRALAAAGDYRQAEERLTLLAVGDRQQAASLLLELGFITLPDPDRRLVATAWSAIAVGRAVDSLVAEDDFPSPEGLPGIAGAATVLAAEAPVPIQSQTSVASTRRSPQQLGALLEQATVDLFARFFAVEDDKVLGRLRRQGAGTQFGHDIEAEWTVAGSPTVRCHVECKNLGRRVTVDDIAGKLADQKYHHRGAQIDHWILISPHHDGANDLPGMLNAWDQYGEYPFSVQIWSPETRVREMFALEPAVYEAVYGRPPTQEEVSASSEAAELIRQSLAPRLRISAAWRRYLTQPGALCFVNEDSRHFDALYDRHLPLRAADERGALLDSTLMDQVTNWAEDGSGRPMLLLADFGEGKSVFTYCLARRLSEKFRAAPDDSLFPLRVPLREFWEAGSARRLLERRLGEIGVTLADWRALAREVQTLVMLDGFDEMSADLSPDAVAANLRSIRSCLQEFSGSKVLITSRQRVLEGSRDWKRTLDRLGQPQVTRIASGPRGQRVRYLEQFTTDEASARALASLRSQYDPIGLAAKPLFLEMIKETLRAAG